MGAAEAPARGGAGGHSTIAVPVPSSSPAAAVEARCRLHAGRAPDADASSLAAAPVRRPLAGTRRGAPPPELRVAGTRPIHTRRAALPAQPAAAAEDPTCVWRARGMRCVSAEPAPAACARRGAPAARRAAAVGPLRAAALALAALLTALACPAPAAAQAVIATLTSQTACATGTDFLPGASTVTYTLSNAGGSSPATVAYAINTAIAASASVTGLEAAGVGYDLVYVSSKGIASGTLTLFSLATGMRCGVLSGGVLNRTGFPADASGESLYLPPQISTVGPWLPNPYAAVPASLVCSSCVSWPKPPTPACTNVAHRYNASSVVSSYANYSVMTIVNNTPPPQQVQLSGRVLQVNDVAAATGVPALPFLFTPLPSSGAAVAINQSADAATLYGITPADVLCLTPASTPFTLGGGASGFSALLTFLLPSLPPYIYNSSMQLLLLGTLTTRAPAFNIVLGASSDGTVRATFNVNSTTYGAVQINGTLQVQSARLAGAWVTVVLTMNTSGVATLYVRDQLALASASLRASTRGARRAAAPPPPRRRNSPARRTCDASPCSDGCRVWPAGHTDVQSYPEQRDWVRLHAHPAGGAGHARDPDKRAARRRWRTRGTVRVPMRGAQAAAPPPLPSQST